MIKQNLILDMGEDDVDIQIERSLLFEPFPKYDFIKPDLDLDINPDFFLKWLELEDQEVCESYKLSVSSMCEYSCLYLAMKFRLADLKGELRLVSGNFGFWEHWWVEYKVEDKTYIIDLTLQQFVDDAPRLAISEAKYSKEGYMKDLHCDYSYSVEEYCNEKGAFKFYKHPLSAEV